MHTILLVEDEAPLRELIGDYFTAKSGGQWRLLPAADGTEGLLLARSQPVDLFILDVMLPDMDGFSLCQELRRQGDVPILFLSARTAEEDRLRGYGLGADDYMTKPFSQAELFAKAGALLRRSKGEAGRQVLSSGGVELDILAHTLSVDGERVGQVLRREDLLLRLWGWDFEGSDRVVDSHIRRLRKLLGPWSGCIRTVFKTGYKWEP